jgi:hypothetical protein
VPNSHLEALVQAKDHPGDVCMAIVYHGKVDSLKTELAKAKPYLDERYREVLGEGRIQRLRMATERLLREDSFFDDYRRVAHVFSTNLGLNVNFGENAPNKFLMVYSYEPDKHDRFKPKKIGTAPAIYVSDIGTKVSSSKNILHSYVHEFNHFIWYALQRVPIYLANCMISQTFQLGQESYGTAGAWLNGIVEKLKETTQFNKIEPERLMNQMFVATYAFVLNEHYEKSNALLDRMILGSIGVEVELEWRHQPRKYIGVPITLGFSVGFPIDGDPYGDLSDQEVIDHAIGWEKYHVFLTQTGHIANFMNMLRQTKVSKVSLRDLHELSKLKRK